MQSQKSTFTCNEVQSELCFWKCNKVPIFCDLFWFAICDLLLFLAIVYSILLLLKYINFLHLPALSVNCTTAIVGFLVAGFVSYSLPRIPLLFRERGFSSLQKPDYVTCDVAFVYGTDFLVRPTNRRRRRDLDARQGQRYKRATRVYLDADVLYGDIVNPAATGVSDANLTFMVSILY